MVVVIFKPVIKAGRVVNTVNAGRVVDAVNIVGKLLSRSKILKNIFKINNYSF